MYIPSEYLSNGDGVVPLPGYESAKPMLYASIYPVDANDLEVLFSSVDR